MKKLLYIIVLVLLFCSCQKRDAFYVSSQRKAPYLYYEEDVVCNDDKSKHKGYVTFEAYMWNQGFPDTIIVEFTYNGKFVRYDKAVRSGILEDSLGNSYSPAYKITAYNGDNWVYDVKGNFIEFNKHSFNDPENDPYVPYNP